MRRTNESKEQFNPNAYIGREYDVFPRAIDSQRLPAGQERWSLRGVIELGKRGLCLRLPGSTTQYLLEPEHLKTGVYNSLQLRPVPRPVDTDSSRR